MIHLWQYSFIDNPGRTGVQIRFPGFQKNRHDQIDRACYYGHFQLNGSVVGVKSELLISKRGSRAFFSLVDFRCDLGKVLFGLFLHVRIGIDGFDRCDQNELGFLDDVGFGGEEPAENREVFQQGNAGDAADNRGLVV